VTNFFVKTKNCDSTWLVNTFITPNAPVVVNFVLCNTPPPGCEANFIYHADSLNLLLIHFQSTSTPAGQIVSWNWDFGDGSPIATTGDPWHLYAAAGVYHVCLTIVTANGCSSTKCLEIHVGQNGCEAGFYAHADSLNALHIHFQDNSTPAGQIISRSWEFGDGGTSTTPDPWHFYATAGVYHVCLTITTLTGCTSIKCIEYHFGTLPAGCEAHFEFSHDSLNAPPYTYHFFDTSTGNPNAWLWNFGDPTSGTNNTSTSKNSVHIFFNIRCVFCMSFDLRRQLPEFNM